MRGGCLTAAFTASAGVAAFGESGDINSLYRAMGIHADDIVSAVGRLTVDPITGRRNLGAAGGKFIPPRGRD